MSNDFLYDQVRYPAQVYPKLHPSRLAAIARLHGVPVASPKGCRLLEVGCGDGLSLLALAMAYPDSQFVGVDLSHAAIARGNAMRARLGLDNLSLLDVDLLTWEPGDESFDFVIAHGFYSWVPPEVRERLLALCNQTLAPKGVACISYNALPGCHMRRMLWDMLKFHSEGVQNPTERVSRAQEFLDLLKTGLPENSLYATTMSGEIEDLMDRLNPNVLFHDDLAEINDPCTLDQFVRHARENDLTFVAEANYHEMSPRKAHERVQPLLEQIARDDLVAKEQYLDFFTGRRFRQTILCRIDAAPASTPDAEVIGTLQVVSGLQPDEVGPDVQGRMRFSLPASGGVVTDNAVVQAMLKECADICPQPRWVLDLLDSAMSASRSGGARAAEMDKAQQFLTRAFEVGLVELHCDAPRFANAASQHPRASRLAQLQLEAGESLVTSLRPSTVEIIDPITRSLLLALDGHRDRREVLAFMAKELTLFQSGEDGNHAPPIDAVEMAAKLDANLATMARLGLLHEAED